MGNLFPNESNIVFRLFEGQEWNTQSILQNRIYIHPLHIAKHNYLSVM